MNAEVYADFLRAVGHRVVRTESAYWFDAHPRALLAFPYHKPIEPGSDELKILFRTAVFVRFLSESSGVDSYYMACDQKPYTFASMNPKARNKTRCGLENWRVDPVDCGWLAERGQALNAETLKRQGRSESAFSHDRWRRFCREAAGRPGFEAWAAVSGDRIGAVALTFEMGDVAHILLQRSATLELGTHPNNALTFAVTHQLLDRPEIRMVFYGLRPLAAGPGLDRFKAGMGYRKFPVRESFLVTPLLRPLLPAARLLASRIGRHATNDRYKKLATALHYIQK